MNILVYGGKGWIGSQFIELLTKAKFTYHLGASRVDNVISLQAEIKEIQPTHIIFLIIRFFLFPIYALT